MGEKRERSRRDLLGFGLGAVGASVLSTARSEAQGAPTGPVRAYRDAASRRRVLYSLLGDLPDRDRPISARGRSQEGREGYVLETLELDLNGIETVPAYLARPRAAKGRVPAVLYDHSHGGGYTIGKKELLEGREYLQKPPYAKPLTDAGYLVLCIDHWVFGERSHTSEADTFKAMLWQGQVLWGMMVYDSLRAMDWLVAREDVDASRVATLGMSMGSTMAFWLAALDERVKVTVDICCQTEFHTLIAKKGLAGHGTYYYRPGLLKHFTTSDIDALIMPRPPLAL